MDEQAFLEAIAASPSDGLQRLMFADWLEERGRDAEAEGQRWAAQYGSKVNTSVDGERSFLRLCSNMGMA